jgi:hypothetical protein
MSQPNASSHPAVIAAPASIEQTGSVAVDRAVIAHRIVQIGILATLLWKWTFFRFANGVYESIPLDDPFFPALLRSPLILRIAFLATVATVVLNIFTTNPNLRRSCSWITLLGATALCLHQGSYNDMTFVTAWWTSLWAFWFVHRLEKDDQTVLLSRAALLSRLIISVILLGGAIGKWTGEYWSGEVFYDIYFRDRDFWAFNFLRSNFDTEALREIAMWYSRKVVVIETVAGLGLWLLPPKWAAGAAVLVLTSIALLSNTLLFSVLSCLIGLAAVGFLVPSQTAAQHDSLDTVKL